MPILMNHYVMLQCSLIYTGITRANKICVLIDSTKALGIAIKNMEGLKRNIKKALSIILCKRKIRIQL